MDIALEENCTDPSDFQDYKVLKSWTSLPVSGGKQENESISGKEYVLSFSALKAAIIYLFILLSCFALTFTLGNVSSLR